MSDGKATELRGMVNYLLEQAQRREDEASRHPADSLTRIHFAAMAEADRDTATELGILARQFAQAQADQQARLRGLELAARDVIYRAGECGLLTSLRTDLQGALLTLRAVLDPDEAQRPCTTCGGSGVISQVHSKNIPGLYDAYAITAPCPDCRPGHLRQL